MGRSAGITAFAACALSASAFLIPAGLAPLSDDKPDTLAIAPLNAKSFAIQLPCGECNFRLQNERPEQTGDKDEDLFSILGGAHLNSNDVVLNFTISEDGENLQVNGETIYPMELMATNPLHSPKIYVHQAPATASLQDIESGDVKTTPLEVTGHMIQMMEEAIVSPEGDVLIPIRYTIYELDMQPVSLEEVEVKLLKAANNELFILHGGSERPPPPRSDDFFGPPPEEMPEDFLFPPPPSEHDHHGPPPPDAAGPEFGKQKECIHLPASLCKLRNIIDAKIVGGLKKGGFRKAGCHGRKGSKRPHMGKLPGHIKPHFLRPGMDSPEHPHHHGRPHHMRPHGHNHDHRRHHFMHAFTHGLAAVLIPTMAGIAVGMTVSLIGLLVGRMIGFLWIKFYRGGRRGYASVALDETTVEEADSEKIAIIEEDDDEPLPVYEEAPTYEAAEKEQK